MSSRRYRRYSQRRSAGKATDYGSIEEDGRGILQEDEEDSEAGQADKDQPNLAAGAGSGAEVEATVRDGPGPAAAAESVRPAAASRGPLGAAAAAASAASAAAYLSARATPDPSTCFRDGRSKIDFVLVYEEAVSGNGSLGPPAAGCSEAGSGLLLRPDKPRATKHELWRTRFLDNLRRVGLEMEEEVVESDNKKLVHFLKLHATWPVMCHYAEELSMRAPLQIRSYNEVQPNPADNWSAFVLSWLRLPNIMAEDVPGKPLDFYTCPFRRSKIDRFLGSENHQTYFSSIQRSRVLYEILSTAMFGKKKKGEVGIDRLVEEGVFSSAFCLHDGPFQDAAGGASGRGGDTLNARQVLYDYWARWGRWYKYQPLDHIREYFGEKIAIYFAWLGFYTGWLLPAALVGVLVFMYGLFTINDNPLANQVCRSGDDYKMCPLCDENIGCKYWSLSDVCGYARLAYLFDHPGTVFYAIFISLWAVTFLEYWKRKCASLAHHWDCTGFQEEEERPRPEFAARAPFLERNPVTGVREPHFPKSLRHKRVAAGIGIIFLMMSLVIIFIVAVIIYRVLVSIPLFQNATFRSQAQSIANLTGAVVNLVLIMAMSRVYEKLAFRLTTWEMHRTQTEFDDNLTFKVFIFQFVNFYSSIFYIAFFKGRFVGYPGNYTLILRLRNEDCSAGGCLIELAQQLAVIMIGKQMINNAQELLVPKLKAWWQKKQVKLPRKRERTRWEEDYQLIDSEGLFQEYLEMVLQFGFITIFVAAFPLAPLFALLNNWVEIRLDAHKLVCETRRPVAERAENIGIWFKILHMLAHLAVISNGFLIAFTSEFLPKLLYQYEYHWNLDGYVNFTLSYSPNGTLSQQCRYRGMRDPEGSHTPFFWRLLAVRFAFVIIFEHVVFGICRLIDILVPDIPESLELKIKRERYLAKQALQDSDTILQVAANHTDDDALGLGSEPPFSGMVLDLTAELGSLMPPLLIAAPSSTELAKTAQGPSVLRDLLSPAPSSTLSASPTARSPAPPEPPPPEPPPKRRPKADAAARGRPRPRPRTIADSEPCVGVGPPPRHSMSATVLSKRQADSQPVSADNSGTNTASASASRSPQSVPEGSLFEYAAMSASSLSTDSDEAGDPSASSRRRARITVKRRARPTSALVGEVLLEDGGVREVVRRSQPSRLDRGEAVAVTVQLDWPESSSVSEASSSEENLHGLSSGLAMVAARSAASLVCSVHPSSAAANTGPATPAARQTARMLGSHSVGSDLSSLVSQDPDSFSDLHLRHGLYSSPKRTPTKTATGVAPAPPPLRGLRELSDSLGSDISSLAGHDAEQAEQAERAEQWSAPLTVTVNIEDARACGWVGAGAWDDIHADTYLEPAIELRESLPPPAPPPALARASSSKVPRRVRRMPSREKSVSVTSGLGGPGPGAGPGLTEDDGGLGAALRHGTARTDIDRVGSASREEVAPPAVLSPELASETFSVSAASAASAATGRSLSSDSLERTHSKRSSGMSFGSETGSASAVGTSQLSDEASWPSSWSKITSPQQCVDVADVVDATSPPPAAEADVHRKGSCSSSSASQDLTASDQRVGFRLATSAEATGSPGRDPQLYLHQRAPPPPPPRRRPSGDPSNPGKP